MDTPEAVIRQAITWTTHQEWEATPAGWGKVGRTSATATGQRDTNIRDTPTSSSTSAIRMSGDPTRAGIDPVPRSARSPIKTVLIYYCLFGVHNCADLSRNDPRGAGSAGSTAGSTCTPAMTRRFVCLMLRRGQGRSIEARRQVSRVSYPAPRPEQRPPRAHS